MTTNTVLMAVAFVFLILYFLRRRSRLESRRRLASLGCASTRMPWFQR